MINNERELMVKILKQGNCYGIDCKNMFYTCPLLSTGCNSYNYSQERLERFYKTYFTDEELFEILL